MLKDGSGALHKAALGFHQLQVLPVQRSIRMEVMRFLKKTPNHKHLKINHVITGFALQKELVFSDGRPQLLDTRNLMSSDISVFPLNNYFEVAQRKRYAHVELVQHFVL